MRRDTTNYISITLQMKQKRVPINVKITLRDKELNARVKIRSSVSEREALEFIINNLTPEQMTLLIQIHISHAFREDERLTWLLQEPFGMYLFNQDADTAEGEEEDTESGDEFVFVTPPPASVSKPVPVPKKHTDRPEIRYDPNDLFY